MTSPKDIAQRKMEGDEEYCLRKIFVINYCDIALLTGK